MTLTDKSKLFIKEAVTKVTTYVALAIAAFAQLAEHAQDLHNNWPQLMALLPPTPYIVSLSHAVDTVLAVLVVYTRVRRMLKPAP
jgi:hypothetical protein